MFVGVAQGQYSKAPSGCYIRLVTGKLKSGWKYLTGFFYDSTEMWAPRHAQLIESLRSLLRETPLCGVRTFELPVSARVVAMRQRLKLL
jgi:hypothetical protein